MILSREKYVEIAILAYLDNIYINEGIAWSMRARAKLIQFWLGQQGSGTDREQSPGTGPGGMEGARQIVMETGKCSSGHFRCHHAANHFSLCGKLVGYLPVCGWLGRVTGVINRRANAVAQGWGDEAIDILLTRMVEETVTRVQQDIPTRGDWCSDGKK